MYPLMEVKETTEDGGEVRESYVLRPMNCPHHHKVYASSPRSYRDLPLRLAEYGQVYRFEDSGAVGGLVRVRGMCMNDAHIYCTAEQVKDEFKAVMAMYAEAYRHPRPRQLHGAFVAIRLQRSEGQGEVRRQSAGVGGVGADSRRGAAGTRHQLHRRSG